ncbi:ATP-binding SpoIIE family protein phosphatase [Streptomyces sp. TRM70350]|uniref:ATP-binding SpoIIE family protein phosphatase n=1 Tax=Streptomyces sp. TRM70350 TaxID=2856165 RepID=UPI001C48AD17|nr:ATP-binding SpoIIE family protein phosphatase [Streptomyces sp. TRM70350]MBV7697666.1 SpoIIE family protein phosphatase [Streptomyces sp. TRM70350]
MGAVPAQRESVSLSLVSVRPGAQVRAALNGSPLAPGAARGLLRAAFQEWTGLGLPGAERLTDRLAHDAMVVLSELVTNAVVHAGTDVELVCRLEPDSGAVVVEVCDHHPSRPPRDGEREAAYETPEYGRGLRLVAALSEAWGVTYRRGAKTVWARVSAEVCPEAEAEGYDPERTGFFGAEFLAPGPHRAERDRDWLGRGALSFLAEASDLLAGQLDEDLVAALTGQLIVPRLADWCAVWLEDEVLGGRAGWGEGGPRLARVWHTSEERIEELRRCLEKEPPRVEDGLTPSGPVPYPWPGDPGADSSLGEGAWPGGPGRGGRGHDHAGQGVPGPGSPGPVSPGPGVPGTNGPGPGVLGSGDPGRGHVGQGVPGPRDCGHGDPGPDHAAQGVPGPGNPGPGHAAQGIAGPGVPGRGIPGTSGPGPGVLGSGDPGRGHVGQGVPGPRDCGHGDPGPDHAAQGVPGPGNPGPGHAAQGIAGPGVPDPGNPGPGHAAQGIAGPGVPGPGHAAQGVQGPGVPDPGNPDPGHPEIGNPPPATPPPDRPWPQQPHADAEGPGVSGAAEGGAGGTALSYRLVAGGQPLGSLVIGRAGGEGFPDEITGLVEDLSRRVALAIGAARQYARQATISAVLQRGLLPGAVAQIPGVRSALVYEPCDKGGPSGDFYDVFPAGHGRWCFAVGDVQGKGPEAAVVIGLARPWLRLLAREGYRVADVLDRLNQLLLDDATEAADAAARALVGPAGPGDGPQTRFLSLLYGELAPFDGGVRCTLASAGHPLPLLLGPDGDVRTAARPQTLLGVVEDETYTSESFELRPGDTLLCVTDGVTERRSGSRQFDDGDGLAAALSGCAGMSAELIAERIRQLVHEFGGRPPEDDLALLVLQAE